MVEKRFVFHAGLAKTGTTSIQAALVKHSDALRDAGVDFFYDEEIYGKTFPKPGVVVGPPQRDGMSYFASRPMHPGRKLLDWAGHIKAFAEDDSLHTFVFSNEVMALAAHVYDKDVFSQLREIGKIRFVVYLRSPVSLLNSAIIQNMAGMAGPLPREEFSLVRHYLGKGFLGMLAPLDEFGECRARDFDKARLEGNLVEDCFAQMNCDAVIPQLEDSASANKTNIAYDTLAFFLALKHVSGFTKGEWRSLRGKVMRYERQLNKPPAKEMIPPAVHESALSRWNEEVDEVNARYGLQMEPGTNISPGPEEIRFSSEYADAIVEAVFPTADKAERDCLKAVSKLANQNIEDVLRQQTRKQKVKRLPDFAASTGSQRSV